jgi:two-component system, NtrC family, response regulator AtoC
MPAAVPHGRLDVLVADDDADAATAIAEVLRGNGHVVTIVGTAADAIARLDRYEVDLALVDVRLPDGDGLEILRRVRSRGGATEVIVMSGLGSVADAVAAIKADAIDYLAKPLDVDRLIEVIGDVAQRRAVVIAAAAHDGGAAGGMVGRSRAMAQVRERLAMFAATTAPVLINGDSGTGKELAARMIHDKSPRRRAPFVAVNCAAFPDGLIESEMFGHVKGSFTGAIRDHVGRIAAADGGTLFLDEVAELTPAAQAKLLRFLENGAYSAVGSNATVTADVRVVSATNRNLRDAIAAGRFREDLYYRLKVLDVRLPSLVERHGDLPLLVAHFLRHHATGGYVARLTPQAWAALQHHSFPGNIRELDHLLHRAVTLAGDGKTIRLEHLPDELAGEPAHVTDGGAEPIGLALAVERFEREYIRRTLHLADGNRSRAAELLGISRKHLWHKMRRYRITDDELDDDDAVVGGVQ